tara:strand:+ start:13741 stop:13926 length:186 start_codon:yes stop_codon:yes gene_type:complete
MTVSAMHEQVHSSTDAENQDQGKVPENVHLVFLPEKKAGDTEKDQKRRAVPKTKRTKEAGF